MTADRIWDAALRLHRYILNTHWDGRAVAGPDPGIRFNARIGRFIKSYLRILPWPDALVYTQAQSYWIQANWLLADVHGYSPYAGLARDGANHLLSLQRPEGYWDYPNPEWRGRIATVEGCFGAIELIETYARTAHPPLLEGARKWYRYLWDSVGFHRQQGAFAVHYFANRPGGLVPNNTTLVLQMLARLYRATGEDAFLHKCRDMVAWLGRVQLATGELPYAISATGGRGRPHFLCYQYNAFEFLDLACYGALTGDDTVRPILERLAAFLASGLTHTGAARYDCTHSKPEVLYYTVALARALSRAAELGLGDFRFLADRAYGRALSRQRPDGGFAFYSQANYGILSDRRSYPRYLSIILTHLIEESQAHTHFTVPTGPTHDTRP